LSMLIVNRVRERRRRRRRRDAPIIWRRRRARLADNELATARFDCVIPKEGDTFFPDHHGYRRHQRRLAETSPIVRRHQRFATRRRGALLRRTVLGNSRKDDGLTRRLRARDNREMRHRDGAPRERGGGGETNHRVGALLLLLLLLPLPLSCEVGFSSSRSHKLKDSSSSLSSTWTCNKATQRSCTRQPRRLR